ncbi:MAG: thioredoxin [Alphaproteobacteria bacterium]
MSPLTNIAPLAPAADDPIKDVGLATFMMDVIEASKSNIVIVDFWAPWCGPCKQLGPALEKVVRSYKGAVRMAKVDIDQNQEIAQQMGIQSIPAVFAFFQGRPVDGFQGALPEAQIKSWVERLLKATGAAANPEGGLDTALKQAAEFLAANDVVTAQSIYTDILDMEPSNAVAYAGLLRCFMALGEVDRAKQMLESAPADIQKDKALDPIRTALELAEQSAQTGPVSDLQGKVEKDPADLQARYDLALAYYAADQKEKAVDELLDIVKRNRTWNEEAARKQLVKFFEAFGVMDPLTVSARKRLSSILFS